MMPTEGEGRQRRGKRERGRVRRNEWAHDKILSERLVKLLIFRWLSNTARR